MLGVTWVYPECVRYPTNKFSCYQAQETRSPLTCQSESAPVELKTYSERPEGLLGLIFVTQEKQEYLDNATSEVAEQVPSTEQKC